MQWYVDMYLALYFPDWSFLQPLIANFDLFDFFASNDYNPFAWVAQVFADQLSEWDPTWVRRSESAPDDAWHTVFGDVYEVYHRRYVWTFEPPFAFYSYILRWIMDWVKTYLIDEQDAFWDGVYGFDLQC